MIDNDLMERIERSKRSLRSKKAAATRAAAREYQAEIDAALSTLASNGQYYGKRITSMRVK
jgi:hypothetical protein